VVRRKAPLALSLKPSKTIILAGILLLPVGPATFSHIGWELRAIAKHYSQKNEQCRLFSVQLPGSREMDPDHKTNERWVSRKQNLSGGRRCCCLGQLYACTPPSLRFDATEIQIDGPSKESCRGAGRTTPAWG
jgi:hypothetical protein